MKLAKSKGWISQRRALLHLAPDPTTEPDNRLPARTPVTAAKVTRTFRRPEADPVTLADALVDYLDADGLQTLVQALTDRH